MPPISVLGCMIVNRADLTLKMLRSIDHPVDRVVLSHNADTHEETNNEVDKLMEQAKAGTLDLGHKHVKTFITYHHHKNLGFSAGANQIIMGAPDAAYWLIANNDISFRPGSLEEIAKNMADSICTGGQNELPVGNGRRPGQSVFALCAYTSSSEERWVFR